MNGIMCRYFTRAGKAPFAQIMLSECCVIEEDIIEIDDQEYEVVHQKHHFKTTDDNPQMYCDFVLKAIDSHDDPTYSTEDEENESRNRLLGQVWVIALRDNSDFMLHHFHADNGTQTYKFMTIECTILGKVRDLMTFRKQSHAIDHCVLLQQLGKMELSTRKAYARQLHLVMRAEV